MKQRSFKILRPQLILWIALFSAIAFPRFEKQGISYQRFLWSSEYAKNQYPSPGFVFKSGDTEGAKMWNRLRLGFPFGATTLDGSSVDGVIQGRVETAALLINLLLTGVPAIYIYTVVRLFLWGRRRSGSGVVRSHGSSAVDHHARTPS